MTDQPTEQPTDEPPGQSADRSRPTADAEPERYEGRPLLVLVENYILDTIGALDRETEQRVAAVVRRVFGEGKDWRATFRRQLGLDEEIDGEIALLWDERRAGAKSTGEELHPIQFAKLTADEFFADLLA